MSLAEEMAQEAMEAARSKACTTRRYYKRIAAGRMQQRCNDLDLAKYAFEEGRAHERLMAQRSHRREATLALTDHHVAALEKAIRAEGYTVLVDPETGDVKLERAEERAE